MNRSYLFIPASNAGMILSSMVLDADAIIFDLEDGVAPMKRSQPEHYFSIVWIHSTS